MITIDILQASRMYKQASNQVIDKTIKNCFRKTRFIKKETESDIVDETVKQRMAHQVQMMRISQWPRKQDSYLICLLFHFSLYYSNIWMA